MRTGENLAVNVSNLQVLQRVVLICVVLLRWFAQHTTWATEQRRRCYGCGNSAPSPDPTA